VALAALGAATELALVRAPVPPLAFAGAAALLALLLVIRVLPLRVRRPVVFVVALALLVALTGGLAYFQFVIKPVMVKGFITAAFAPKPTSVTAETARVERWSPELTAIGTLRAYQGVIIAPQAAGVVTAKHFESGDDVETGALLINIDDSVEQADLANGLAQLKNAEATLRRAVAQRSVDPRVRQNLALVVGLQGRFKEAEDIARADLPPDEAAANVAYLRQMLAHKNDAPVTHATRPSPGTS